MTTVELEPQRSRPQLLSRFVVFGLVIALVTTTLAARLAYLQLLPAPSQATTVGDATRIVLQPVPSARGLIYDRDGKPVVTNVPTFVVQIRPSELPFSVRASVVTRLGAILDMSPTTINQLIDRDPGANFDLVPIASDVPEDTARVLSEDPLDFPGVHVGVEAQRDYAYGPLLAQILGYTGAVTSSELKTLADKGYLTDDWIGRAGVEQEYETDLRGTYGTQQVEEDATGLPIQVLAQTQAPVSGDSLQLSIDVTMQQQAQKALDWGLKAAGLKSGVIAVMNPQTGEVLAMVSMPTYDDNLFAKGISRSDFQALATNKYQPLLDHAISEQYAPGSTYKLVTGSGALQDGKIRADQKIQTYPYIDLNGFHFVDWNHRGFGPLDIYGGFGNSSDTYFYQVAAMLGIDRLAYWGRQWGFGGLTGIDLPGEVDGNVPTNQWKIDTLGQPIYPGEVFQAGIGQGYDEVTAIQLLDAYSALANGGKLYQPQVVRQITGPSGQVVRSFAPELTRKLPISQTVLKDMRVAARTGVNIRHTYNLVDEPFVVAAKTGTAEFGIRNAKGEMPFHDWFAGFVPADPWKTSSDPSGFKAVSRTDSNLAVVVFAYDANTVGNAATEIAKYFLQLHYAVKVDLRLPQLLKRGDFYGQD
ncbi:MAG TPA: penicillin-binding protein 2 [Candidatus Limnocylindrales bacterium]|nr:penicillin-binding protein 2 [Candidatus Limnocylindrales bacterium]